MRKIAIWGVLALMALALAAVPALGATTITPTNANSGTHFQVGTATCSITNGVVTCPSYELAGVGNFDAVANLSTNYTATVQCRNHGGQIVEVKSQVKGVNVTSGVIESKNGRLLVPTLTSGPAPTAGQFEALATCPNGNWTKETLTSTITASSFTYTLTFVDKDTGLPAFPGAYITITSP